MPAKTAMLLFPSVASLCPAPRAATEHVLADVQRRARLRASAVSVPKGCCGQARRKPDHGFAGDIDDLTPSDIHPLTRAVGGISA